jgi:hypothetical protein
VAPFVSIFSMSLDKYLRNNPATCLGRRVHVKTDMGVLIGSSYLYRSISAVLNTVPRLFTQPAPQTFPQGFQGCYSHS